MIPITVVRVEERARELVNKVLDSGSLAQGKVVDELEGLFYQMTGARHWVAVSNGTQSLGAALEALAVKAGDEVITSRFNFCTLAKPSVH